jgi:hypothetical protein
MLKSSIMWLRQNTRSSAVRLAIGATTTILTACGSGTTSSPTAPSANVLHAEVTDPVGDAVAPLGVANPPDLIHGTVDVSSGNITFTIQFAPGTLNPQSTRVSVELDTDQSASTGNGVAGPLGVDYTLDLYAASQTTISGATPSTCSSGGPCYTTVGTASLTLGMDTMTTTVPLATLGNASGRMNFRIGTYLFPPPVTPTPSADWMPDITLPPVHVP